MLFDLEYAALFIAAQEAVNLRNVLKDLGYPQAPTDILCDNACAVGLATNTVKQRRSKSIDMRFHWIRDRIEQNQFTVSWRKGALNLADFFTKILPVATHKLLMPLLVTMPAAQGTIFEHKHTNRIQSRLPSHKKETGSCSEQLQKNEVII